LSPALDSSESENSLKFWFTIALLPLLPFATVVQGGFLGFGTGMAMAVVAFLFAQSKRKMGYIVLAPVGIFVGLSLFVNYMAARNDIRDLVWYEQTGFGKRLERVAVVFQNFEWLDLSNLQHREAINYGLNRDYLVGMAVDRLQSGQVEYLFGTTFGNIFIGLIPRVVWPDKPP
jgi:hypothetical protein